MVVCISDDYIVHIVLFKKRLCRTGNGSERKVVKVIEDIRQLNL